jgi:hypothetical protein
MVGALGAGRFDGLTEMDRIMSMNKRRYTSSEYDEMSRKRNKSMKVTYRNMSPAMMRQIRNEVKYSVRSAEEEALMDEMEDLDQRDQDPDVS